MSKVAIVYWTGGGNTENMANAIADGAKEAGADVTVFSVEDFSADKMDDFDVVAWGCSAQGDEELEDTTFLPVYDECTGKLSGKKTALFGSYGWGDGEWMRKWDEQARGAGAVMVADFVIANEDPDDEALEACKKLGKALA